jgi:hypothetical protein
MDTVLRDSVAQKKTARTFSVRAGRPVTQLTSNSEATLLPAPKLEYIHHSIDWGEVKYKNRNKFSTSDRQILLSVCASKTQISVRTELPRTGEKANSLEPDGSLDQMANTLESSSSKVSEAEGGEPAGWLKVGAVAAASALAGGLLAAWWYRKTLTKLRQAEENGQNPHFGIPDEDTSDEA